MSRKVAVIIGAGRGLGGAIAQRYSTEGFYPLIFSRSEPETAEFGYHFIRLSGDYNKDIYIIEINLRALVEKMQITVLSSHFLLGGSLGMYSENDTQDINKHLEIFSLNAILPFLVCRAITATYGEMFLKEYHFYSSAVSQNRKAHPSYSASKAALESLYKSLVSQRSTSDFYFLYRLGLVAVRHKYPYALSKADPAEFKKRFIDNIPSKHFAEPSDIAEIAFSSTAFRGHRNCAILDLTGGQSWA